MFIYKRFSSRHLESVLVRINYFNRFIKFYAGEYTNIWLNRIYGGNCKDFCLNFKTFFFLNTFQNLKKRKLACESLKYNLNDKLFCELFPDIADELNEKLKDENSEWHAMSKKLTTMERADSNADTQQNWTVSLAGNLFVVLGLVGLYFVVKYIVNSVN